MRHLLTSCILLFRPVKSGDWNAKSINTVWMFWQRLRQLVPFLLNVLFIQSIFTWNFFLHSWCDDLIGKPLFFSEQTSHVLILNICPSWKVVFIKIFICYTFKVRWLKCGPPVWSKGRIYVFCRTRRTNIGQFHEQR